MVKPSTQKKQVAEEITSTNELAGVEVEQVEPTEEYSEYLDINEPFDPQKIKVVTETPVIDLLMRRISRNEIDMMPDFQRRKGIWDPQRKSRLIESVLLRIPLPVFYMAADENDNWAVVDGLQRLDAFSEFTKQNGFPLHELEYLKQFNDHSFHTLPRGMQRRIEETQVYVHVIQPGTPPEVKFNIFKRINTGGMPLSAQEIRHAIFPGAAREFLKLAAESEAFLSATTNSIRDERMAARECVLRFAAFYTTSVSEYSRTDLDTFLSLAMKRLNDAPAYKLKQIRKRFDDAMKLALELFGDDAFRKRFNEHHSRFPINRALFEIWSVHLAKLNDADKSRLIERKEELRKGFMELMSDPKFEVSVTQGTGQEDRVRFRFNSIHTLISLVLA